MIYSSRPVISVVDALLEAAGLKPQLAPHSLTIRVLRIGPAEARALLAANFDNRRLRWGRVRFYARCMQRGEWPLTHQGIAFAVDGRGLDLQHRLHAIIIANVTVDIMVTEGLEPAAFKVIDQHERRSMADALGQDRFLTEAARFFLLMAGGGQATTPTLLEVGEASGLIEDYFAKVTNACGSRRQVFSTVAVRAATMVLLKEQPQREEIILQNYRNLVLNRSEDWPKSLHAFNRQYAVTSSDRAVSTPGQRLELFARALHALDPTRPDLSIIKLQAETIGKARARGGALLEGMAHENNDG